MTETFIFEVDAYKLRRPRFYFFSNFKQKVLGKIHLDEMKNMSWIIMVLVMLLKVNGLEGATKASKHLKEYLHISAAEDRPLYHERSKVTVSYKCQGELLNAMGITCRVLHL